MEDWQRLMQELLESSAPGAQPGSQAGGRLLASGRTPEAELLRARNRWSNRVASGTSRRELEAALGVLRRLTWKAESTLMAPGRRGLA